MSGTRWLPFLAALVLCLALAAHPLLVRSRFDARNRSVLLAVDLDEVGEVARALGRDPADELARFANAGANACITTTHTLSDLVHLGEVRLSSPAPGARSTRVQILDRADPYRVRAFLERLQPVSKAAPGVTGPPTADRGDDALTYPGGGPLVTELKAFRDRRLEEKARAAGMTPIFRLNNSPWAGPVYVDALTADLPQQPVVVFDEKQVLGWPSNTGAAAAKLKEKEATICVVEFAGQVGVREMAAAARLPTVLLHSISTPEMAKLNLARILPRWARAATERNTRVLVAHFFPHGNLPYPKLDVADANAQYIRDVAATLKRAGFEAGPPLTRLELDRDLAATHPWATRTGIALAIALLIAWVLALLDLLPVRIALLAAAPVAPLVLAALALEPATAARLAALALGTLTPAAATLAVYRGVLAARGGSWLAIAAESAYRAAAMLAVCLTGGLLMAAALTSGAFVFRLDEYLGVKAVYLSGPAAALIAFLWLHRVNPLARPLRVRDVVMAGGVLAAGTLYILRSGNFISVSATGSVEYAVRDAIEGFAAVRPRTKELLVGYPALVLLGFAHAWRDRLFTPFLLIAASVSAVSAVNSFCHVHTPPLLSIARGVLAVPPGLALGLALVPLYALLAHTPRKPLVTISGYLGFGNFGDELLLANALRLLREAFGERVTLAPFLHRGAVPPPGTEPFDRLSPAALIGGVRNSLVHVSLGGGLFQDRTSRAGSLYYAVPLALARLFLVPRTLVIAQSVDVRQRWLAALVARALAGADLLMARDRGSARALASWGLAPVTGSDLATWYPEPPAPVRPGLARIGVSLRPLPGGEGLKASLAAFEPALESLGRLAKARGAAIVMLALQPAQDRPLTDLARSVLAGVQVEVVDVTAANHGAVIASLDAMVATRFHAMLLALLAELPCFALSYDPKTEDLLDDVAWPHRWRPGTDDPAQASVRLASWLEDPAAARALSAKAGAALRVRGEEARKRALEELSALEDELAAIEADGYREAVVLSDATTRGGGA